MHAGTATLSGARGCAQVAAAQRLVEALLHVVLPIDGVVDVAVVRMRSRGAGLPAKRPVGLDGGEAGLVDEALHRIVQEVDPAGREARVAVGRAAVGVDRAPVVLRRVARLGDQVVRADLDARGARGGREVSDRREEDWVGRLEVESRPKREDRHLEPHLRHPGRGVSTQLEPQKHLEGRGRSTCFICASVASTAVRLLGSAVRCMKIGFSCTARWPGTCMSQPYKHAEA